MEFSKIFLKKDETWFDIDIAQRDAHIAKMVEKSKCENIPQIC